MQGIRDFCFNFFAGKIVDNIRKWNPKLHRINVIGLIEGKQWEQRMAAYKVLMRIQFIYYELLIGLFDAHTEPCGLLWMAGRNYRSFAKFIFSDRKLPFCRAKFHYSPTLFIVTLSNSLNRASGKELTKKLAAFLISSDAQ